MNLHPCLKIYLLFNKKYINIKVLKYISINKKYLVMEIENNTTYKYTAIIVEPRKHKALEFVLNNVCDCLTDEWRIILFHGKKNDEYAIEIVGRLNNLFKNRISLVNLYVDNLNQETYSQLLANKNTIYDHVDTDVFIVFQTDSMILKKNAHRICEYLHYDYVGSPWLVTNYQPTINCNFIGNGGFSLRNKKKMLEIIENVPYNNEPEDLFFATNYNNIVINKPSFEKALEFCEGEATTINNLENIFAVHQFWPCNYKINTNDNVNHIYHNIIQQYPECGVLLSLQNNEE